MKEQILKDFRKNRKNFDAFKDRMINLLRDLIEHEKIYPHQIIGRTKETSSLSKKIEKKGEKYSKLSDITDVVGVRIITYLESDVDPIASIIEREFKKDEGNSIDKRILQTDQFGYRSLHIVASLNDNRLRLPEYSSYKSIKFEIQVRSILQHAWAEIEHDLGYKGADIPEHYKRSFNRVAALLELADIEFVKLKSALDNYEKDVPELIESKPEEVDINKASLSSFLNTDSIIEKTKTVIVNETNSELYPGNNFDLVIDILNYYNIKTIRALRNELEKYQTEYLKFVKQFIIDRRVKRSLLETVSLTFFGHYLASKTEDPIKIKDYLESCNIGGAEDSNIQSIIMTYQSSQNANL